MALYLGRPGVTLTEIRAPRPGVDRSPDGGEGVHDLLGGGRAVDRAANITRTWQMSWVWDDDVWRTLSALYRRQFGPGPFALCDPAQINYLTANQAGGANASRDATGFTAAGGETVAASATLPYQGDRSLLWSIPSSPTSGILTLGAPSPLTGFPTPAAAWTFFALVRLGAGDSSVEFAPALRWLDSTGAQVSETVGTAVTAGTSAWSTLTVSGSAPSTAVYVVPRVKATLATVGSATTCHLGQAQLQISPTATTWTPGEGPALVSVTSVRETAQLATADEQRRDITLTLAELGVG